MPVHTKLAVLSLSAVLGFSSLALAQGTQEDPASGQEVKMMEMDVTRKK